MAKRKRRAFSAEFKAEAVRLCKLGDRSIAKVAQDLDLTPPPDAGGSKWQK